MDQLEKKEEYGEKTFEEIKHMDKYGDEYWEARELQDALKYKEWRFFEKVINNAITNCINSKVDKNEHFGVYSKLSRRANNAEVEITDYRLSRYACYLIVQNGNPRNKTITLGKTYFAVQTRKQELSEQEYSLLTEEDKRFYIRKQTKDGN